MQRMPPPGVLHGAPPGHPTIPIQGQGYPEFRPPMGAPPFGIPPGGPMGAPPLPQQAPVAPPTTQLLAPPSAANLPNCATVAGLPWFFTEEQARVALSVYGQPKLLRVYEDPLNGRSRGIFLVGFADHGAALSQLRKDLTHFGPYPVTVSMWCLSSRWNPVTPPPPIPGDVFPSTLMPRAGNAQYAPGQSRGDGGNCGVRGVVLGEANTATPEGFLEMERARKKHRAELGMQDVDEEEAFADEDGAPSPGKPGGGMAPPDARAAAAPA